MDQVAGKQLVADSVHGIKVEINQVEHEAIRARQVIEQRLKGFEIAWAWSSDDLTKEFAKWQANAQRGGPADV